MRCEMFVWPIFAWLILVGNTQVSLCSTCSENYLAAWEIDFDRISKAGVTIKDIGAINVSSAEECAKSCCEETSDDCSIVTFEKHTNSCSRYSCRPLHHCFLTESLNSESLTIKLNDTLDFTASTSTVTTSSQSSTSEILLRISSSTEVSAGNISRSSSEKDLKTTSVVTADVIAESTTYNSLETSPEVVSSTLKVKADDDSLKREGSTSSSMVVYFGNSTTSEGNINSTSLTTTTIVSAVTENLNETTDTETTNSTLNNETSPVMFYATVKTKIILKNETELDTPVGVVQTEESVVNTSVTTSLISTNETKEMVPAKLLTGESDQLRKDIHLIVALVIGLGLLITVLGLVVRRFYDGWQRRHYQRMDFLIDGMYNSPSS